MKSLCRLTFIVLLLQGCSGSGPIEQRIGDRVNGCNATAPCIVKITDVTDFQWDQLYVFDYGATRADIEKSLGTDFPTYVEFTRRIVFLKSGNIVRREDEPTDIERAVNGEVAFTEANADGSSNLHGPYTPETAVFRAEKKSFAGGVYYVLTQLK